MKDRIKGAGLFLLDNADVAAALLLGVAFALLGLLNVVEEDGLTEATLAVLSVLAFALVRERTLRAPVDQKLAKIDNTIAHLDMTIEALEAGRQYHVAHDHAKWDITAADGSLARATRRKKVKVVQNNVLSLLHYSSTSGVEEKVGYKVDGRDAPVLRRFNMHGKSHALVFLGRVYSRDETLEFVAERTLRDVFVDPVNSVSVTTEDVTAQLRMTVVWPPGRTPTAVRLEKTTGGSTQTQPLPLALITTVAGRPTLHFDIPHPERSSRTAISWDWDVSP